MPHLPPIYLSKVPANDEILQKHHPKAVRFDVVARETKKGKIMARWPWHHTKSKPHRNCKSILLNCIRREVVWN
jgi:hypothetical protein